MAPSVQSLRSSGCLYLEQVGKCAKGQLVMNGERWQDDGGEELLEKGESCLSSRNPF